GDYSSLLARAETQTAAGADALFNRLDALGSRPELAAALFPRWAERIVAGAWNPAIAELVAHAEALERMLHDGDGRHGPAPSHVHRYRTLRTICSGQAHGAWPLLLPGVAGPPIR